MFITNVRNEDYECRALNQMKSNHLYGFETYFLGDDHCIIEIRHVKMRPSKLGIFPMEPPLHPEGRYILI